MATEDHAALKATAATLLKAIEKTAETFDDPASLRNLAEAYSLIAGADPKKTSSGGSF